MNLTTIERSCLYNLKPLGLYTPFVESLTSYLNRLAYEHCLHPGTMFNEMIVPLLNKKYLNAVAKRGGNSFFDETYLVNGYGEYAQNIKAVAEFLTGRNDLIYTTLIPWQGVLSERGLLRKTKAWCPICITEMEQKGEGIYEPLVWSFGITKVCSKHRIYYTDCCQKCLKRVPFFTRGGKPGYCPSCYHWLGGDNFENELLNVENSSYKTSLLIEDMITYGFSSKFELLGKEQLCKALNKWVTIVFNGSTNKASKITQIPLTTLKGWLSGRNLPRLEAITMICLNMNLKVKELLLGDIDSKDITYMHIVDYHKESQKRVDHEVIKNYLLMVIETQENISLTKIADKVGCDRKVLTNNFSEECKIIVNQNNQSVLEKKNARITEKVNDLKTSFDNLVMANIYPSRRRIECELGNGFLKETCLQNKWKELKSESLDV